MVCESLASSIAIMFYACDYATRPNMVCAPLLVALRDGLARLEASLRGEAENERLEQLAAVTGDGDNLADTVGDSACSSRPTLPSKRRSKLEREASRRLIRQASAAQQAQVKGDCLMILQMLTRREVVRSHLPWQLMTKHAMWMAFEHRRQLKGLPSTDRSDLLAVTMLETSVTDNDKCDSCDDSATNSSEPESDQDHGAAHDAQHAAAEDACVADKAAAIAEGQSSQVKVRRKNESFYDDYVHRGSHEMDAAGKPLRTPLADMSFLEYGAFVRIVLGDPWALRPCQYAFEDHHTKFQTHVQELRPAPAVPYTHGFTMPTVVKDAETNACFKQLLLRPHACRGPQHCLLCSATHTFCEATSVQRRAHGKFGVPEGDASDRPLLETVNVYSYIPAWRRFEAQQQALAGRADSKIRASRKYPILPDTDALRGFWLPEAMSRTIVQESLLPILCQLLLGLHESVMWRILRLAGHVRAIDRGAIGIAGTHIELPRILGQVGANGKFTGPGVHDEQLTVQEFLAWRCVEYAARLDFMAEARGRPRLGREHPDAVPDDADGVQVGCDRDDDATFEKDGALPGAEDIELDCERKAPLQVDPQLAYQPRHRVSEDEVFDSVHRLREAEAGQKNTRSQKRRMFDAFSARARA